MNSHPFSDCISQIRYFKSPAWYGKEQTISQRDKIMGIFSHSVHIRQCFAAYPIVALSA